MADCCHQTVLQTFPRDCPQPSWSSPFSSLRRLLHIALLTLGIGSLSAVWVVLTTRVLSHVPGRDPLASRSNLQATSVPVPPALPVSARHTGFINPLGTNASGLLRGSQPRAAPCCRLTRSRDRNIPNPGRTGPATSFGGPGENENVHPSNIIKLPDQPRRIVQLRLGGRPRALALPGNLSPAPRLPPPVHSRQRPASNTDAQSLEGYSLFSKQLLFKAL